MIGQVFVALSKASGDGGHETRNTQLLNIPLLGPPQDEGLSTIEQCHFGIVKKEILIELSENLNIFKRRLRGKFVCEFYLQSANNKPILHNYNANLKQGFNLWVNS